MEQAGGKKYDDIQKDNIGARFSELGFTFNAKELDNETGLYYYGARYLDPTGAMWLSVDPLFEKYAGMSPYNYCAGNPVKLVDPDGRENTKAFDSWADDMVAYADEKLKDPYLSEDMKQEYENAKSELKALRDSKNPVTFDVVYFESNGNDKYNPFPAQSVNSNTIDYLRHHPTELGKVMPHCKIEFFMYNGKIVDFFNKKTK